VFVVEEFTRKELEIIKLIAEEGLFTRKDLAEKLVVSEITVRTHIENICTKIGTNRIAGVVKFYFEEMRGR
jgi:DNA-binding NarL/FixJ family response regulator